MGYREILLIAWRILKEIKAVSSKKLEGTAIKYTLDLAIVGRGERI